MVGEGWPTNDVMALMKKVDFMTMHQDAILKAMMGRTTLEEVLRVTEE